MELNKVYCADNLQVMQSMTDASIDLIYIDPPFNTNRIQKTATAQFSDSFGGLEEYLNFMMPRLQQMHRLKIYIYTSNNNY
jgi:site-specific DNA-methyltransferase (adenine-specific)